MPPGISALIRDSITKFKGYLVPYINFFMCKFGDPRSNCSRSDVIIAKFSHFPVKSALLQLNRSGAKLRQMAAIGKKADAQ